MNAYATACKRQEVTMNGHAVNPCERRSSRGLALSSRSSSTSRTSSTSRSYLPRQNVYTILSNGRSNKRSNCQDDADDDDDDDDDGDDDDD